VVGAWHVVFNRVKKGVDKENHLELIS